MDGGAVVTRRDWLSILLPAGIGCVVVLLVAFLHGCAPAAQQLTPEQKKAIAEETYRNSLLKCVADNPTREASDKCQADVDVRWHVTVAKDGGK